MTQTDLPIASAILLTALVLVAAIWDLRTRRIPNWLTVSGLLVGLALSSFLFGWVGLKQSLAGMGIALAIYIPLSLLRAMGMGDVKLMAAVGALVGPLNWLYIFIITSLLGGVIALVMIIWSGRLFRTWNNVQYIFAEMSHLRAPYLTREELSIKSEKSLALPHGAVIALGCLGYMCWIFL